MPHTIVEVIIVQPAIELRHKRPGVQVKVKGATAYHQPVVLQTDLHTVEVQVLLQKATVQVQVQAQQKVLQRVALAAAHREVVAATQAVRVVAHQEAAAAIPAVQVAVLPAEVREVVAQAVRLQAAHQAEEDKTNTIGI